MCLLKQDGKPSQKTEERVKELIDVKRQKDELTKRENEIKQILIKEFEEENEDKLETSLAKVAYVEPTKSLRFDSTKFKKDHKDLYEDYVKESVVKASIRLTIK